MTTKPPIIVIPKSLDEYFSYTQNIGSMRRSIGDNLYGINNTLVDSAIPSTKNHYGFTFFVRPQLNLSSDNIKNKRIFYSLLTDDRYSFYRYVRCILDPRGQLALYANSENLSTPLVDNNNPFIPIASNSVLTVSGWPDTVLPTFTSRPGLHRQQHSQADGITEIYESFDLNISFRNIMGDPLLYMIYMWLHYMSNVFRGDLNPYLDFIAEREIDYNTRIYRVVLDQTKKYVTHVAATGASFPINVPNGQFYDFSKDKPYNQQNNEFTVRFKSIGAMYDDHILIKEFNDTVHIFNAAMRGMFGKGGKGETDTSPMMPVPEEYRPYFKNKAIPRIEPSTNELRWFIPRHWLELKTKVKKKPATPH